MKTGDKVRFLNDVGGGYVRGFKGKDIVLVEDEDGFEIPTPVRECIVVEREGYKNIKEINKVENKPANVVEEVKKEDFPEKPVERKGGENINMYLAFTPVKEKEISVTSFKTFLINKSNYYIHYAYFSAGDEGKWVLRSKDEIDPNTKMYIEEIDQSSLNDITNINIQIIAYKKDKPFALKAPLSINMHIPVNKFYKLHSFSESLYFKENAMVIDLVTNDVPVKKVTVDADKIKQAIYQKQDFSEKLKQHKVSKDKKNEILEVDLHINELLDNTNNMTPAEIKKYQIEEFTKVMEENKDKKGKKIVFIHGKGNGILRHEIEMELKRRYKNCIYQDASFQEYGYGATQVKIG